MTVTTKICVDLTRANIGARVNAIPRLLEAVMSALNEYRDVVKNRAAWRTRINALEEELLRMENK